MIFSDEKKNRKKVISELKAFRNEIYLLTALTFIVT